MQSFMKQFIIDRFEEDYAVLESPDRTMTELPRDHLPVGANVGDVLLFDGETYRIDTDATEERRRRIEAKMNRLWT